MLRRFLSWLDDRSGLITATRHVLEHPVPPRTGWWYVFGSATFIAFVLQVATGIALASSYVPSSGQAYESLKFITEQALLGRLLRGMHFFGASAMVLLIGIHVSRTFLMGAFKYPRELNWLTGAVLLLLTLALAFTGQLLRWDQNAVWSVIVGAAQAGRMPIVGPDIARFILAGDTIGGATLSRFFAFHVFFIPAIVFAFVGLHLVLVLRHGISERPRKGDRVDPATYRADYAAMLQGEGVPFWPDAAWRDVVFGAAVVATIVLLAVVFGPPALDKPPDPSILEAYPRPDWYFLWYFAVLALTPHSLENFIIVAGPLVFGAVLLLLPLANRGSRSVRDRPLAAVLVVFIWTVILAFWVAGQRADWSPNFEVPSLPASVVGSTDSTVVAGARLFHEKGCEYCHAIDGYGGKRGPDLSDVRSRMPPDQIGARITNGSVNMPAFAKTLTPDQVNMLVAFLATRGRSSSRQ
ncbi:MAG TPA: cytochrome b N-terminal domain-containing protein [Gemmatimonadales bacterium]|nr:cytochrome b N-terminal domain-containing protein [Gemmatimonadales bacterium]